MAFRFKQFIVEDDRSTMRIGTDAILLGAWAETGPAQSALEIGTGCGVISLMLAQKSNIPIDAIDIDEESAKQAGSNFMKSPWSDKLHALHVSLQQHVHTSGHKYDLIITNPPFFSGSLKSPDEKRNRARHSSDLSQKELIGGVMNLLAPGGSFLLILPFSESVKFSGLAATSGLFLQKKMKIRPKAGKPVNRILNIFGFRNGVHLKEEELIIRNADNSFTKEYLQLTQDYHHDLL